ncbi:UDP-glucuronic acid decarboxylase family protein [Euzebya tangerina]|uniref:UDP-glucuronic acid decarboxylase family protein n=1 Tax=Euzebya tangerina TaxID=591198 RepID=UPI000E31A5D2|nr:UDP-glucuronic acid decarboxylase family protein [Euzebya tangerina]
MGYDFTQFDGSTTVITGGAGFLGSHLSRRLIELGAHVIVLDNLSTGRAGNIDDLFGHSRFRFMNYDVTEYLHIGGEVDFVLHWASPASPIDYLQMPIQTMKVGGLGTHKALGLARNKTARFMLASTSEVYGDPEVHPQPETYWGNVNPVGPRGVYDEAKRYAEALTYAYHSYHGLDVRVPRIFNTFGPFMRMDDGRAVPTFIGQALRGEDITVFGDGMQTRSLCFVDDLVEGLLRLLSSDYGDTPVNIGNPHEMTILDLAERIIRTCDSTSRIVHQPAPIDDPRVRRPDTSLAERELDWHAQVPVDEGLARTVAWVRANRL